MDDEAHVRSILARACEIEAQENGHAVLPLQLRVAQNIAKEAAHAGNALALAIDAGISESAVMKALSENAPSQQVMELFGEKHGVTASFHGEALLRRHLVAEVLMVLIDVLEPTGQLEIAKVRDKYPVTMVLEGKKYVPKNLDAISFASLSLVGDRQWYFLRKKTVAVTLQAWDRSKTLVVFFATPQILQQCEGALPKIKKIVGRDWSFKPRVGPADWFGE